MTQSPPEAAASTDGVSLPPLPAILPTDESLVERARHAVAAAREHASRIQRPDGHWCGELQSNATITAEYVFMRHALGLDIGGRREPLIQYFFGEQQEDGSWGLARRFAGDVSTTGETYLALRLLGVPTDDPRMQAAQRFVLARGGLETMRVFSRIFFAMFGLFPWGAVPTLPAEFIFLPAACPVNVYALSSWARGTIVPLLLIFDALPLFALPNGKSPTNPWLDELWLDPTNKHIPYAKPRPRDAAGSHLPASLESLAFTASGGLVAAYEKVVRLGGAPAALRQRALRRCEQWTLERQEPNGDWGGIFPPMLNSVLALFLRGHSLERGPLARGLEALERFCVRDAAGLRVEPCQSPVWDTVLMLIGLLDSGARAAELAHVRRWIERRQILSEYGDWRVYNRTGEPGGWSFEYTNTWYPDVDDTAAAVIALLKHDPFSRGGACVSRAVEWMVSMQNDDGGWAAFDKGNDKTFLNDIPFSDMDSLCDPSTPDVTGRVLEALGILDDARYRDASARGIRYLRACQEPEGSWFGRWGVNYIYGTSNVLVGLARQRIPAADPMVSRAAAWLRSVQNADGGWGECLESYAKRALMGKGRSTASQTAWALMGLLGHASRRDRAVQRGVRWLVDHQTPEGSWNEEDFTGTGFPNHFFLRYDLYRHYFPLMALGRFLAGEGAPR